MIDKLLLSQMSALFIMNLYINPFKIFALL